MSALPPVVAPDCQTYADLFAKLVDENTTGVGLGDVGCELAECLTHKTCLRLTLFSPISPSISALGVSAATESMTTMFMAPNG